MTTVLIRALITAITLSAASASPDPTTWARTQPQQTLHSLMVSIEERLHSLESSRLETTLKQIEQRLDSLESTVRRLDTALQDKLDKLDRNLNSKELKDDLTVEKLSLKMRDILDSSFDRYNRRLGYAEERIELSLKTVQMGMEAGLNTIDKQQEDTQTEVLEMVTLLEDLKTHSEDRLNSTHRALDQKIQSVMSTSEDKLEHISGKLEHLSSRLNNSLSSWSFGSQNDGPSINDIITTVRNQMNIEGNKFTNKMNNMYNDLWRRVVSVETTVKDLSRTSNSSQREVLEEVRSLALADHRDFPGDSQENFLEVALDALERKLQRKLLELGRRLDSLSATQNLVMDSCFDGGAGVCQGLESRLSQVLERIFDVYSDKIEGFSNRTVDLDELVMEMMELVKTQHSQLLRTVTHNTNMVVTLAKNSSDSNKLLQNSVTELTEKTDYKLQELLQNGVNVVTNSTDNVGVKIEKTQEEKEVKSKIITSQPTNITEVLIVTLNSTHLKNNPAEKYHESGVLKITADNFDTMADNETSLDTSPFGLELNVTQGVDSSIFKIISMMSPNLTQMQLETLLHFLNSSVSLENLEAVIQNTEADSDDDILPDEDSMEEFGHEYINKVNTEVDMNTLENQETGNQLSLEIFDGKENVSEEINYEPDQERGMESTTAVPELIITSKENKLNVLNSAPKDFKDEIKVYTLLLKSKQQNFNFSHYWDQVQQLSNHSDVHPGQSLIHPLQKLCFGQKITQDCPAECLNNALKSQLLLISQTINNVDLYNKIDNICNTMTESLLNFNNLEDVLEDN